ncbi:hypothetical protein [Rhodopirellula sp. P2]|uniref:hypothetical protein n=1 Tax=Rhodopirellula sp. P2 TaxID=2127060 RepID=UPI002367EAC2|nr:hypothetical protein [Rhodopirellula sp. P2]WDQ14825.1 hypothetical protein PSR62_14375 [Rhodopirellula sp. P2]
MTKITFLVLLSLALVAAPGCQPSSTTDSAATSASESGGDDHGHDDHGDHEGHDHDADGHEGHDHGDHEVIDADAAGLSSDALVHLEKPAAPKSFAAAVEKLAKMKTTIAGGFADDDVDSIHNELHDIGTLLEQTEALAKSSDLNEEQKKQALAAVDALFDAFGSVDAKLHGENGAEYSEVSGDIDDSIKVLGGLQ